MPPISPTNGNGNGTRNNNYPSLREQKRTRLKQEQDSLRAFSPTTENLKRQQEALTNALLIRKPTPETKKERLRRVKEQARLNKDMILKRQRQMELDAKLKKQFNIQSKGLFFPYGDVRVREALGLKEKDKEMKRKK